PRRISSFAIAKNRSIDRKRGSAPNLPFGKVRPLRKRTPNGGVEGARCFLAHGTSTAFSKEEGTMTMGRTILASLFAAGIFASPASAQERDADNPLEPGLWEANLSASAAYQNFDSGGERFEIGGTASLGYFLTEWFELGGEISYIFSELDLPTSETQTTSLLAGPRIVINVPTGSPFVPYGIASGGVAWAETEVNDMDVFEE